MKKGRFQKIGRRLRKIERSEIHNEKRRLRPIEAETYILPIS
jgi:hypothetical protein